MNHRVCCLLGLDIISYKLLCSAWFLFRFVQVVRVSLVHSFLIFFFLRFIFERDRDRMRVGWGRERGRHRIWSRLQALSCQYRAWRRAWPHELWDHDLSRSQTLNRLSHPGAPIFAKILNCVGQETKEPELLRTDWIFYRLWALERQRPARLSIKTLHGLPPSNKITQCWTGLIKLQSSPHVAESLTRLGQSASYPTW